MLKKKGNEGFPRLGFPRTPAVVFWDYNAQNSPFFPSLSQKFKLPEQLSFPGMRSQPGILGLVTWRHRSLRIFPQKRGEKREKWQFSTETFSPGEEKSRLQLGFCLFLLLGVEKFPGISPKKVFLPHPNTLESGNCIFQESPPPKFQEKNH